MKVRRTTIALITPTLGRETLRDALQSGLHQLGPGDEWWIVADGRRPSARRLVTSLRDPRLRYREHRQAGSTYGNAQRNVAMRQATADYFLFLDDDDQLGPTALDAVRREGRSRRPLMFKMDYRPRDCVLWQDPVLRVGNVGGAMFVVPNRAGSWVEWPETPEPSTGDFHFILRTLARWPVGALRWCEDVICRCLQHGEGQ